MNGDNESAPVSTRVIETVAKEKEKEPTELEPLYYTVDPEFLNEVFPATTDVADNSVHQFTFTYEHHVVNVTRDGAVDVFPQGGQIPDLCPTDPRNSSGQSGPETPD